MVLPEIDYTTLTDSEVAMLKAEAALEEQRRIRVALAPVQAEEVATMFLQDVGRVPGSDWVQPEGAHDCYPKGYTVMKDGKTWKSKIPANTTCPGSDPRWWEDLTTIYEEGAWNPNFVDYVVGDVVTYEDETYTCLQSHTSQPGWTPFDVPALWVLVVPSYSGEASGTTIFVGTSVGIAPTVQNPEPYIWDPNSVSYSVDDLVMYNDKTYKCLQAHTSQAGWTPAAVPALWQLV